MSQTATRQKVDVEKPRVGGGELVWLPKAIHSTWSQHVYWPSLVKKWRLREAQAKEIAEASQKIKGRQDRAQLIEQYKYMELCPGWRVQIGDISLKRSFLLDANGGIRAWVYAHETCIYDPPMIAPRQRYEPQVVYRLEGGLYYFRYIIADNGVVDKKGGHSYTVRWNSGEVPAHGLEVLWFRDPEFDRRMAIQEACAREFFSKKYPKGRNPLAYWDPP
jgi:hypothetical protein